MWDLGRREVTRAFLGWTTVVSGILDPKSDLQAGLSFLRERSGQGDPPSGAHNPLRSQGGRTLATGHRGRRPLPGMWGADQPEPVLCVPEGLKEFRGGGNSDPRSEDSRWVVLPGGVLRRTEGAPDGDAHGPTGSTCGEDGPESGDNGWRRQMPRREDPSGGADVVTHLKLFPKQASRRT